MSKTETIGERIKKIRQINRLTQKDFGELISRTVGGVQQYEYGKRLPDESTLKLISVLFRINLDWLKTGDGEMLSISEDKESCGFVSATINLFSKLSPDDQDRAFKYIQNLQRIKQLEFEVDEKIS